MVFFFYFFLIFFNIAKLLYFSPYWFCSMFFILFFSFSVWNGFSVVYPFFELEPIDRFFLIFLPDLCDLFYLLSNKSAEGFWWSSRLFDC